MGIICKKCNYERKPEELVSEQECPNCGVFYFKYDAWLQKQAAKHGVSEPQILDPVQAKAKAYIEKAAQRREQTTPDAKPSVREKTVRPTTSIATTTPIVTATLDSGKNSEIRTPIGNLQDIPDQLKKWAELRDTGVITDSEFTKKKNDLLSNPDTTVLTPSPLSPSFKPSSQIYGPVIKEAIPIPPPTGWQLMWKRIGVALFLIGLILSSAPKSASAIGYGTISMWIGFALAFPGTGVIRIGGGLLLAVGITDYIHQPPSAPNYSREVSVESGSSNQVHDTELPQQHDKAIDCLDVYIYAKERGHSWMEAVSISDSAKRLGHCVEH